MAPRRGGGIHIGGGGSVGGGGIKCTNCDTTLNSMYFNLISDANTYGQLIPNVIFAAALLGVFFINRRPAAKLAQLATFCFFTACVFQSVRWGLITHNIEIPHGYRCEASIIVMMQRVGWPVLLAALLRAMRPGKILGAGPWAGLFVLSVLNVTYVVYDFILTDLAIKDFKMSEVFWSLSDRDFGSLWSKSMVDRFTDQPEDNDYRIKWSQDDALRYRAWNVYMASGSPNRKDRDTQIKIGLAADVVALLVVLALGGLHAVTWRRQGKAELPRRRSFIGAAFGGLLLSSLFRVIISARWILPNWKITQNKVLWQNWLDYFPDTNRMDDEVYMPDFWLPGYRNTIEAFPVLQVIFEQIGPVVACALVVLSMTTERKALQAKKQEEAAAVKMQQMQYHPVHYNLTDSRMA